MPSSPIPRPANEGPRLAALHRFGILDTPVEPEFDFITELAAQICWAPYACVVLVDDERIWIKSAFGLRAGATRPRDDDYCAWSILQVDGLSIEDVQADPRTALLSPTRERGYRMYSGVNLHTGDGLHIGTLCVLDTQARVLTGKQQRLLAQLGRQVMSLIELRAAKRELQQRVQALDTLAHRDELTGLANRRELAATLERCVAQVHRYGTALSVLLLDVDHFKSINDDFGHDVGDAVLHRLGLELGESFRDADVVGRYGGEEFLVVMPATDAAGAARAAELFRQRIAALEFHEMPRRVTVSGGVASFGPRMRGADGLVRAADRALYRAKAGGRNRVEIDASDAVETPHRKPAVGLDVAVVPA